MDEKWELHGEILRISGNCERTKDNNRTSGVALKHWRRHEVNG